MRLGIPKRALLALLLSLDLATAQAVLGIDLGQSFIKAALVKPGIPLEIVLTKESKRKETNAIAFKPAAGSSSSDNDSFTYPERLYGIDAASLAARFPDVVFPNLKMLLGKELEDDAVKTYTSRNPALTIFATDPAGAVAFKSSAAPPENEGVFTVEELVAMQLKAVVHQAEEMAGGTKIKDVVFAIPAYWRAHEKLALQTAAELAGLKVKSLITDGLAVGVNYAVSRNFEVDKPEYHVVYDMGAGSSTATVLRFQGKKVKDVGKFNKTVQDVAVVGFAADELLGGDALNDKMVDYLVEEFLKTKGAQKEFGEDAEGGKKLRKNGRSAAKLWKEATRTRQILSANTDTQASVESLFNDIDFRSGKLTRAEFESRISEYQARVTQPILDAISVAGLSLDEISSVILHGGAIRTPYIAKQLEGLVGANRISKNVNSDEAAVFGAAFKAASLSGAFKVKEIQTHDTNPYSVAALSPVTEDTVGSQTIFKAGSSPGKEKVVTFDQTKDFSFILTQNIPNHRKDREHIFNVHASNVTASVTKLSEDYKCPAEEIQTRFTFKLSPINGVPKVLNGWVECEIEEVEKKAEEGGVFDGVKDFLGVGKNKDSASPSASSSSSSTKTSGSDSASATPEAPKITKKTYRHPLAVDSEARIILPSAEEKKRSLNTIASFDKTDSDRRRLEETRNSFESYAYSALNHLNDLPAFLTVVDENTKETIQRLASEATEWLYSDDESGVLEAVEKKFAELRNIHQPAYLRMKEHEARPEAIALLKDAVDELKEVLGVIDDEKDSKDLNKLFDDTVGWLTEGETKQETLELWKDPALKVKDIKMKVSDVKDKVTKAMHKRMQAQLKKKMEEEEQKKKEEKERLEKEKAEKKAAEEVKEENKTEEAKEEVKEDAKEDVKEEPKAEEKTEEHVKDEL